MIEDAPSGVEAGLRAGTTVWAVNTSDQTGAHRHFRSLREAGPEVLAFARQGSASVSPA